MTLRQRLRKKLGHTVLFDAWQRLRQGREHQRWIAAGRPLPPPHRVKQLALRRYARQFELEVLVETGTYLGDMVAALRRDFRALYSIELGVELHQAARQRFAASPHVQLLQGDSAEVLPRLLEQLPGPALFWLDGHYSSGVTARGSKDTPVLQELDAILASGSGPHVILIDDARCFTGEDDYPSLDALRRRVLLDPRLAFCVEDDIIRITPPSSAPGLRPGSGD